MAIAALIRPKPRDLGEGFMVRRALPAIERRAIGPFIFFDEMGPVEFAAGQGLDVRPHPHIGLATVTFLYEGEIVHRDSLGSVQTIRPGDVNWMTAGRGIVHSERSPEPRAGGRLWGLQTWVALPAAHEEDEPGFFHHPAATLPYWEETGAAVRVIAGTAFGRQSPVRTYQPTLYADIRLDAGAAVTVDPEHAERAIYVVAGAVHVGDAAVEAGTLVAFETGPFVTLEASLAGPARVMLFGGAPLDGKRTLWWNFVSTRPDRIEQAKADWAAQAMGHVPGESDFIPAPER